MAEANTITVTLGQIAKMIDHALLHPTMTDAEVLEGLAVARRYGVATACVKPYSVHAAVGALAGSGVLVCPVVGFPHGNSTPEVKAHEAAEAARAGGAEVDVVINVGKALGDDWGYVEREVAMVNDAVVARGAILKVIFENDYLDEARIVRLCEVCTRVGVAFVKTSTGFGFVKQANGMYAYRGATVPHLKLMRKSCGPGVRIKAAGGVRTLDEMLHVMSLGVDRVGCSATAAIMEEARARGIGEEPQVVTFKPIDDGSPGGY